MFFYVHARNAERREASLTYRKISFLSKKKELKVRYEKSKQMRKNNAQLKNMTAPIKMKQLIIDDAAQAKHRAHPSNNE